MLCPTVLRSDRVGWELSVSDSWARLTRSQASGMSGAQLDELVDRLGAYEGYLEQLAGDESFEVFTMEPATGEEVRLAHVPEKLLPTEENLEQLAQQLGGTLLEARAVATRSATPPSPSA